MSSPDGPRAEAAIGEMAGAPSLDEPMKQDTAVEAQ